MPNSKRLRGYTRDTQEHKDLHITSCLHGTKEGQARQALDRSRKVVNTKIYELFTWHKRRPDKHLIDQERLSTQRSIYNELFTWAEKYSTNQENLSR